jgi:hypothetical protein
LIEKGKGPSQRNIVIICLMRFFLGEGKMKTREDKRIIIFLFFYFLENHPFEYILKKSASHSLFGAWPFLSVHIRFTPSEEPKDFPN